MKRRVFVQPQSCDPAQPALRGDQSLEWLWKRKSSVSVLDRDLPSRDGAEFGDRLVVPIDHYPVTAGGAVEVFRQFGLDLEDVDLNHDHNLAQKSVSCN